MSTPIDVRTHGPDGHWDYADIKRLCEYRDQLHETVRKLIEGEPVAVPELRAEYARLVDGLPHTPR